MPQKFELDGQEVYLSDFANPDGSYDVTDKAGITVGAVDATSAHQVRSLGRGYAEPMSAIDMANTMQGGFEASGGGQALRDLQGSWSAMIGYQLRRSFIYYFNSIVHGPPVARISVILALVVGFIVVGTGDAILGVLIMFFGGRILGPVTARLLGLFAEGDAPPQN